VVVAEAAAAAAAAVVVLEAVGVAMVLALMKAYSLKDRAGLETSGCIFM
jgi:hypothetical protein